MNNLMLFGKRIRSIRGVRTREAVAETAKISLGYLGELERGEKWPTLDVIMELSRALAVPPSAFLEFESEEVDPKILLERLNQILENGSTKELQQVLRVVAALSID